MDDPITDTEDISRSCLLISLYHIYGEDVCRVKFFVPLTYIFLLTFDNIYTVIEREAIIKDTHGSLKVRGMPPSMFISGNRTDDILEHQSSGYCFF